jgi:hypothetical protein
VLCLRGTLVDLSSAKEGFSLRKRTLGPASKASICAAFMVAMPSFCQNITTKAHEPSPEELKILSKAAVSPDFNSSNGPSLRQCLINSGIGQCNAGSVTDYALSTHPPHSPGDFIRPDACASDLVVNGKVVGRTSALSANEATVITLYIFQIQLLYKAKDNTLAGKTIGVLRTGGTVVVPEGVIRQDGQSTPPFTIGANYILLLRELPGIGGYVSTQKGPWDRAISLPDGEEGRVTSLKGTRERLPFDTVSEFRDALGKALAKCGAAQK